jgi:putative DNA primase/helicase
MDLSNLTGFSLLPLVDASLVLVEETPNRIDEQQLKKLVGGSLVQVDRKYLSPISIRPKAKWLILANRLPSVSDQSLGFWRRMPVVPWPVTVPTHKRDPLLAKRIIETELAGVLVWALEGLVRVLERGRPAVPPKAVQAATQSVMAWVDYCEVVICASPQREKSEVYGAYSRWCRASGMGAVSAPKFWGRLADLLGTIPESRPRRVNGTRIRAAGVKIGFEPVAPI